MALPLATYAPQHGSAILPITNHIAYASIQLLLQLTKIVSAHYRHASQVYPQTESPQY